MIRQKHRADDLGSHVAGAGLDRAIAFGLPTEGSWGTWTRW